MTSIFEYGLNQERILAENYKKLKEKFPNHEYLGLVDFDANGKLNIKTEFYRTFDDPQSSIGPFQIACLINANKKLEEIVR